MPDRIQNHPVQTSEIYSLKHKDKDVALVYVNANTGAIEYVLEVYLPDELPIGCLPDGQFVCEWWKERAIPESRRGILKVLRQLKENTSASLMLSGYGLSLTDHYWLQPLGHELYWKDVNYFDNPFSDELGDLLIVDQEIDFKMNISKFSPSSSVGGEMRKKWVIRNGIRYLMKINFNEYGQQSVNEIIACCLHELTGWTNYNPYKLETITVEGRKYPCSLNPLFTSNNLEFVSAYQLLCNCKKKNDVCYYEKVICRAATYGLSEKEVRKQLEYTILTDFILSNTDRHFNNFGFLKNSETGGFCSMAPIFDTGNSLFYDQEFIPNEAHLLDLKISSFCKREVDMLKYITDYTLIDLKKLSGFDDLVYEQLTSHTEMPLARAKQIADTVYQKIQYLREFYQGKKIWKKEKYR